MKSASVMPRSRIGQTFWQQRYLMILTLPAVIWLIVFSYFPMYGVIIAFQDYNPIQGFIHSPWLGWDNYRELFNDPTFISSLNTTLKISLYKLLFGFPAPIILALLLNEIRNQRFKKLVQSLTYLPYFISWVLVAGFMYTLLSPELGILTKLLAFFGLIDSNTMVMGNTNTFMSLVVVSDIWKNIGWNSIIFLAAIAGVDTQLYEAAIVDGAGRFKRIWHITLPSLKPTIVILLIFSVGGLINANFDQMYVLQNSMTQDAANVLSIYAYKSGIVLGRYSYGTAVGLFQSVVAFAMVLGANYTSRKLSEESLF